MLRSNSNYYNYSPLSGTTRVSRYQKGKTNLDFTGARDSEWQWHQLGHNYASLHLAPDRQPRQHPTTHFCRPDALPAAQPTASATASLALVIDPGAVEFRRRTASNFHGVEVVD